MVRVFFCCAQFANQSGQSQRTTAVGFNWWGNARKSCKGFLLLAALAWNRVKWAPHESRATPSNYWFLSCGNNTVHLVAILGLATETVPDKRFEIKVKSMPPLRGGLLQQSVLTAVLWWKWISKLFWQAAVTNFMILLQQSNGLKINEIFSCFRLSLLSKDLFENW